MVILVIVSISLRNLGKIPNLTNMFEMGWTHQLDWLIPDPEI